MEETDCTRQGLLWLTGVGLPTSSIFSWSWSIIWNDLSVDKKDSPCIDGRAAIRESGLLETKKGVYANPSSVKALRQLRLYVDQIRQLKKDFTALMTCFSSCSKDWSFLPLLKLKLSLWANAEVRDSDPATCFQGEAEMSSRALSNQTKKCLSLLHGMSLDWRRAFFNLKGLALVPWIEVVVRQPRSRSKGVQIEERWGFPSLLSLLHFSDLNPTPFRFTGPDGWSL